MGGPSCGSACRWKVSPGGRQYWEEPDPQPRDLVAREVAIDLAGDVTLQDADDLVLGPAFLHPALEVNLGPLVMRDANHHDAPQRAVRLTVATLVGPDLAALLARPPRDGRHAAQVGPGGF